MESVSDVPTDAKGFGGFFKYVFDFDETNKALMFNMIQYSVLAIIPIVLVLKGIGYVIPEDDEDKGSLEIIAEVIGQLALLILSIWFINKMVRYFPTYSGVAYHSFNETNFLIPFLIIMMTMQTRLGEKIKILSERVMELWEGRADGKKVGEKKGNGADGNGAVKVSQPIAGNRAMAPAAPPLVNSSTLGMGNLGGGPSQSQAAQAAAMTPQYQNPDFNQFYQNDMVPLMDANEPMAANEMGSAFGSAW
jgi:hypothetical protein